MDRELPFRRLYGYDSDDEGPQEELDEDGFTKEENQIHFELTGLEKRTRVFRDLSLAHKAVVDGGMRNTTIEPTPCPDPGEPRDEDEDENAYLKKGVKFLTLDDMKVWLSDYAIRNHMPFYVEHSDINLRFTVKCEKGDEGCPWKSHSEETAKWIGEKMDYPAKVDEWLQLQATKSSQQQIITFDRNEMKYQVDEPGGTTRDDHSYGGAAFEVHLKTRWCQCERPSKYHWPCSHLITAAKAAHIAVCDGKTVRMQEFHVEATRLTWAPRFHPFLDQSQWPEYHGTHIKPDPLLMVETKGRRRTKRFRGDMDDLAGYTGMNQFGSGHFMEAPDTNNCGVCDEGRHNTRTCKKRKTSNGGIPSSSSRDRTSRGRGSDGGGRRGSTSSRGRVGGRRGSTSFRGRGGGRRGSTSSRGGVRRRRHVDNGSAFGYLLNPDG
ncbi:hypothetical protein D1007_60479 [Hordeum vulgare]|nr:hypothetical protein D1007_60479 [Hordeum vulgare]